MFPFHIVICHVSVVLFPRLHSVPGESIPIRLFLSGYDLTPTMRDINKKFSVRYYLNLVLVDEEERRYFKQQVRGGREGREVGGNLDFIEMSLRLCACGKGRHPPPPLCFRCLGDSSVAEG